MPFHHLLEDISVGPGGFYTLPDSACYVLTDSTCDVALSSRQDMDIITTNLTVTDAGITPPSICDGDVYTLLDSSTTVRIFCCLFQQQLRGGSIDGQRSIIHLRDVSTAWRILRNGTIATTDGAHVLLTSALGCEVRSSPPTCRHRCLQRRTLLRPSQRWRRHSWRATLVPLCGGSGLAWYRDDSISRSMRYHHHANVLPMVCSAGSLSQLTDILISAHLSAMYRNNPVTDSSIFIRCVLRLGDGGHVFGNNLFNRSSTVVSTTGLSASAG